MPYSASDDYCATAKGWQAVPSADDARNSLAAKGNNSSNVAVMEYLKDRKYSCDDSYQMGTVNDNHIFVSTTDGQHRQILDGISPTNDGGVSGYFTDQATVDYCMHAGYLDNGRLNRVLQVAPFQANVKSKPSYKPHIDCFSINQDILEEKYGTRDFNAALAKCYANNQFGEGGGNQGFNPYLSEMMGNGCLVHDSSKSFSDSSISKLDSGMQNEGNLVNSTVEHGRYYRMRDEAWRRTSDCVKNNTEHPSQGVIDDTGYDHNLNPVHGMTGNGTLISGDSSTATNINQNATGAKNQTDSEVMPTTAPNTNQNATEAEKKTASGEMPTTAAYYTYSVENNEPKLVTDTEKDNEPEDKKESGEKEGQEDQEKSGEDKGQEDQEKSGEDKGQEEQEKSGEDKGQEDQEKSGEDKGQEEQEKSGEDKGQEDKEESDEKEEPEDQEKSGENKGQEEQEKSGEKEEMPTTAPNTNQNATEAEKKTASEVMPTTAPNTNQNATEAEKKTASEVMPTTAPGQDDRAPSDSTSQANDLWKNM